MSNPADHLDIGALQDLKEIMENEFETLVNTFISDSQNKVDELDAVLQQQDCDALRKVAHSLKGSSSNVCAFRLSELARQLEMMGKEETLEGADQVLSALRVEFRAVSDILSTNL
ncbi:Hpt domain-containing protein [Ketobacter sp.]|uniref:Hpt domain-containing protein n=1 Tax=Ketobacter sp. TaxID=2083498 RepID=UPI0025BBF789|nr:Hpt domain-containing protein [Ketobacter sp.]MEE2731454.1 Hpt domain-containing protein [Pseudomonadota bacterium]